MIASFLMMRRITERVSADCIVEAEEEGVHTLSKNLESCSRIASTTS